MTDWSGLELNPTNMKSHQLDVFNVAVDDIASSRKKNRRDGNGSRRKENKAWGIQDDEGVLSLGIEHWTAHFECSFRRMQMLVEL